MKQNHPVQQYIPGERALTLKSDLACEFPIYIYWRKDIETFLYSRSISNLLQHNKVLKPLQVSDRGISFLLQSGVIPPPSTAYRDIYIVGLGGRVDVVTLNGKIDVSFNQKFPFLESNEIATGEIYPNENIVLQKIYDALKCRLDNSKACFLFHSAGKDSNSIALAIAEAGEQKNFTLMSHKSQGIFDESEISLQIAKKFGFKHLILNEYEELSRQQIVELNDYFYSAPFPCTDNVALAYPLYKLQQPELYGSNIIDGGGNDSYMKSPPSARETKLLAFSKYFSKLSDLRAFINSESLLNPFLRTPAEWCGMAGMSLRDSNLLFKHNQSVYEFWLEQSMLRSDWDPVYMKSDILTSITAAELHIRKGRNFCDSIGANFVLPFANEKVADYFLKMPEASLFDRCTMKNKIFLRTMLKNRMGLDSDKIGKMGWTFDSRSLVTKNWGIISKEISSCRLWDQSYQSKLLRRLRNRMKDNSWSAGAAGRYVYRLYTVSGWYNRNRYINI